MDSIIIFVLGGIAIAIWIGLSRLFRGACKGERAENPHAYAGLSAPLEQYPTEPQTRPRQLSWQQRQILAAAEDGLLIYPAPSDDQAHVVSETHLYVQRRPVKALVRASFLEYTPNGYRITPSGSEGLRKLPERDN